MSNKYIIKNCDCILSSGRCNVKSLVYCQDCTECKMKQIAELCNKIISRNGNINLKEGFSNLAVGENFVARQILKLLDIQEDK